jgi:hypothetical protein
MMRIRLPGQPRFNPIALARVPGAGSVCYDRKRRGGCHGVATWPIWAAFPASMASTLSQINALAGGAKSPRPTERLLLQHIARLQPEIRLPIFRNLL